MNNQDRREVDLYKLLVGQFAQTENALLGLNSEERLESFCRQVVDSIKRIRYIQVIRERPWQEAVTNPQSNAFDPLRAAAYYQLNGNISESIWLIFLAIHFGRHTRYKWSLVKNVYSLLNSGNVMTYEYLKQNLEEIVDWLCNEKVNITTNAHFGNHRKYESICSPSGARDTRRAFESFVLWEEDYQGHNNKILALCNEAVENNIPIFEYIYQRLNIASFGRTSRFDYLCMLGKFEIVNAEPTKAYIKGATGPKNGSKELFWNSLRVRMRNDEIEREILALSEVIDTPFKMQVLEDAICNWQKSKDRYVPFS